MNSGRIRVKMCGMTRSEDMTQAINLGVDALGFVFYPQSSRAVSIEQAKALLSNLPVFVDAVAVLVNPEPALVQKIIEELPIQLLQFHGEESAAFCQQFNKPYIKAISADSSAQIQKAQEHFDTARALLLDTPSKTLKGGTGLTFDWNIIPKNMHKSYILAGGLNEFNVGEAVKLCLPFAVDVCTGVEASPGIKDHGKMSRFMQQL